MSQELSYEILYTDPDLALASTANVFVVVWRNNTTMHGVELVRKGLENFAAQQKCQLGLVTIVEPNAPLPESDAKDALADFLRAFSDSIVASALIFEGEGFRASVVRSVVIGMTLMAKQPYPHRVYESIESACGWLAPQIKPPGREALTSDDLGSCLQKIRETLKDTAPEASN